MSLDVGKVVKTQVDDYKVKVDAERLDELGAFGYTSHKDDGSRYLVVHPALTREKALETFWEELWHAVLFDSGFERQARSEPLVKCLAKTTHTVLKRNKKVRDSYV